MGDDESTFAERENEFKPWMYNSVGNVCKTFTDWTDWSTPTADSDDGYALPNYLLCDKDKCRNVTDEK